MNGVPNLATHPFRNERLPATLFAIAAVLLLAFTARHAFALSRLPARSSALHKEVAELDNEAARLRSEAKELRAPKPDAATLAQWTLLKELVDRRAFSWTRLLARLETLLPRGVRLEAINPSVKKGEMRIELTAVCRTPEDILELVRVLEASEEFEDVYPVSDEGGEGGKSRFTMRYRPLELPPFVAGSPAPAASASAPGTSPAPSPEVPPSGDDQP